MNQASGEWFWLVLIAMMALAVYMPRWVAQRRRKQKESTLVVGDQVLTIGGLLGTLTHIDFEKDIAHLQIAEGVEIEILIGAIHGKRTDQNER